MKFLRNSVMVLSLMAFTATHAIELNPGYPENIHADEKDESPLRRGEIIFFISYPFMFLASFAVYGAFGYGMYAAEGKSNFTTDGSFYAVTAITAAILSFGIAMDDHYAIKAQTKNLEGTTAGYLSLSFRF